MAKRQLGGAPKTPVVDLRVKPGAKLVGVLKSVVPTKYGHGYHFILETTDGSTTMKEGEEIREVDVKPGDEVTLFASTSLDESLQQAKIEERIEVIFHGKKVNEKTNREFNNFEASVIE